MDPPFHSQSRNTRELSRTQFCFSFASACTERLGLEIDDLYDVAALLDTVFWISSGLLSLNFHSYACVEDLTPWGLPCSASIYLVLFHWELELMSSLSRERRSNQMAS
jgi:hypothetical protein